MHPPNLVRSVAIVFLVLGLGVLSLAFVVGFGLITWDVKGFLLTGAIRAVFALAVALVGAVGVAGALALWRGFHGGRVLCLAFWFVGGMLALVTDRSVDGPGEPLSVYLVDLMIIPGVVTWLLLWVLPPSRRYFRYGNARPSAA